MRCGQEARLSRCAGSGRERGGGLLRNHLCPQRRQDRWVGSYHGGGLRDREGSSGLTRDRRLGERRKRWWFGSSGGGRSRARLRCWREIQWRGRLGCTNERLSRCDRSADRRLIVAVPMKNARGHRAGRAGRTRRSRANNRHHFAGIDGAHLIHGNAVRLVPGFDDLTALRRSPLLAHRDETRPRSCLLSRLRPGQAGPAQTRNHERQCQ